jgi:hypothetical protein
MHARLILFLLLLLSCFWSHAQEFMPYHVRVKADHGFVVLHTPKLYYLVREKVQGLEVEWVKQTFGEKQWHQRYNFPAWGIAYAYRGLGNRDLLGHSHTLLINTYFPLVRKNLWQANFSAGTGPGIINKKFHHLDHYKNIAIGSHLNVAIKFEANAELNTKAGNLGAALALTHFSNGAYTSPNLGLNIPTFGLTYKYFFGNKRNVKLDSLPPVKKAFEKTILFAAGVKEIAPPGGSKFVTLTGSFAWTKVFGYKSRLGAGIDLVHDPSAGARLERDSLPFSSIDNIKSGLYLTHEWMISDFSMITQAGFYLYAKKNTEGNLYQRIGFRYSWKENYFVNVSLKTHFANADYGEFGIGYRF